MNRVGTGSSRDWAAKGVMLLGVRVLVGMGVLPLQFQQRDTRESLRLTGHETFDFPGVGNALKPGRDVEVRVTDFSSGASKSFTCQSRIDTPVEMDYYRNGGILQTVLRKRAKA